MILAFSLIAPLLGGMIFTKSSGSNQKPDGAVQSYEYSYSATMAYPLTFYKVWQEPAGNVMIAWQKDCSPEVQIINAPADALEHIKAISKQFKLHRLKRSYFPSVEILDGNSWYTCIDYEKGSISSGGQNASAPDKLMAGISAINSYIQSLIDATSESDILMRKDFREFINGR